MSRRATWIVPGAVALLALLALLVAATRPRLVRTASAGAPNQFTIGVLRPGQRVCEGPIVSDQTARDVAIWGGGAGERAQLTVTVQAGNGGPSASGILRATPAGARRNVALDRTVPGGRPLRICLADEVGAFSLSGSPASAPGVVATGIPSGQRFSLVLLTARDQSLLGSLSTAFSRASLWRPSWVGSWTFWVLMLALLASFGLGVVAVVSAAQDDAGAAPPSDPHDPEPPEPGAPSDRSKAGQDRPQPVP